MRRTIAIVALLAATPAAADDGPPTGFIVRATPGFGYAVDGADGCDVQGRKFVGGFELTYGVRPGLLVGAAAAIDFNTLAGDVTCGSPDARLALGFVFGPAAALYVEERLHVHAVLGLASIDDGRAERYGIGGALALGYDFGRFTGEMEARFVVGARLQLAAQRVDEHTVLVPALLATFGFD